MWVSWLQVQNLQEKPVCGIALLLVLKLDRLDQQVGNGHGASFSHESA
jgi:hypothetical protein